MYQTPLKIPTDENEMLKIPDIYNPRFSYGGGKILTELMGIHYGKKYFKKLIIFRPHNVYGPDMGNEHVVPEFIKRFKRIKNKKFKIQGSGNEIRSFIFIDDFVKAFELILRKENIYKFIILGLLKKLQSKILPNTLQNYLKLKFLFKELS